MLTGIPHKSVSAAQSYFDEHLSHDDYYTAGEAKAGRWIGRGCQMLGLANELPVGREAFRALCKNVHPSSGEALTQRHREGRRIFYDFVCSPPKSVSIMAVTMNDQRLIEAHQIAARIAILELEQYASARVRKGGVYDDRTTGNLTGAEFSHTTSRTLDPQLHTHFVLFNCTYDSVEERWKALQTVGMFDAIEYATEIYRNEFVRRIHSLGYRTTNEGKAFEIEGVSRDIQERFSKRAKQRDEAIAKMERKLGRKLTNNEISHLVHQTRSRKLKGISSKEVEELQLAEITGEEMKTLRAVRQAANGAPSTPPYSGREDEMLQAATEHLFERKSVVSKEEILCHALIEGRGTMSLDTLKNRLTSDAKYVRVGNEVSLRAILEKELSMIRMVNDGKHACAPLNADFVPAPWLGDDQREAITHIVKSSDQFIGFRGLAGTGKSTALTEIANALRQSDCRLLFCAPTAAATDVLRKDGLYAQTLQRLLVDPYVGNTLSERSVIVLDEAGAVGLDDMHKLLSLAKEHGARVILSGDTGQHSSVTGGDALRILEEHSQYSYGQLSRIRRQQRAEYLEAVKLAASKKPQQAFDRLDDMGEVIEQSEELHAKAAEAYIGIINKKQSALLVAPTWSEIEALTEKVRSELKAKGAISRNEEAINVFESLGWSESQKQNGSRYRAGQTLVFHSQSGAFAKHESVTVQSARKSSLHVQRGDGTTVVIRLKHGKAAFDVCESKTIAIASGDKLLLQSNDSRHGLNNGQLVEVQAMEGGKIILSDGRIIPGNYRQFTHGYAVTSHASQGKTVDEVLLVASSRSLPAVNREQFYVSISRGRRRCRIFTDNKESLRDRLTRTAKRTAAIELVSLETALNREGYIPEIKQKHKPAPAQEPRAMRTDLSCDSVKSKQRTTIQRIIAAFRNWKHLLQFVMSRKQREKHRKNQQHTQRKGISIC